MKKTKLADQIRDLIEGEGLKHTADLRAYWREAHRKYNQQHPGRAAETQRRYMAKRRANHPLSIPCPVCGHKYRPDLLAHHGVEPGVKTVPQA